MRKETDITATGEQFMKRVATYFNNNGNYGTKYLLEGTNGVLPFSDQTEAQVWTANVTNKYTGKKVTNNNEFIDYIINLYNEYADEYNVDGNVLSAQAFVESEYRCWIYNNATSTASGLPTLTTKLLV